MSKIRQQLIASVAYDAINGDATERGICGRQMMEAASYIKELEAAHNADMDEKDRRIAELEALVADYREDLIDALQDVINYAPACTSSIEYAEKRLKELTEVTK
jgi:ParB-like chromosome segregation protein Spo0J